MGRGPVGAIALTAYLSQKSVSFSGNRLNVAWTRSIVAECRSQAIDQNIKAVFEFQIAIWPQPVLDLFARNQFARAFHQKKEQIQALS